MKDGRIGRLGWKGQTADTEEFVLTACAVEVGLEVPGHNQGISPQAPKYKAKGMDLSAEECASLTAYVRNLPRPAVREASSPEEAEYLRAGKASFASVGCASCHSEKLGSVEGIFSDLLLHDMGQEMADHGSYNGGGSEDDDSEPLGPLAGSKPTDWAWAVRRRTPPERHAAGMADASPVGLPRLGPLLARRQGPDLEQAVALHGGQGAASRNGSSSSPQGAIEGRGVPEVAGGPRAPVRPGRPLIGRLRLRRASRRSRGRMVARIFWRRSGN
ncbi:MAG: di-heme oxidoredictase family protein [Singulisphaera sp.]